MDILEAAGLAGAAFTAATINAVAGGGTLVSFPALIAAGYSSKVSNITNTVSILPGYAGGVLAYRPELQRQPDNVKAILLPTLVGALAGSAILLSTPEAIFKAIVPFLIYGACLLLAFQDRISAFFFGTRGRGSPIGSNAGAVQTAESTTAEHRLVMQLSIFGAAIYGAYFGAGLGIIVLAVLGITLPDDMQRSNALKGIIALLVNALAASYFGIFGDVAWTAAVVMAPAALVGGYLGGHLARRLNRLMLRRCVITYGLAAATFILLR